MIRIILLFLFLTGCARVNPAYIDPEVEPYVKTFEQLIGIYPVGVSISFVDKLEGSKIGECRLSPIESSITLNRTYWDKSSHNGRENIILHELGHCFFWFRHNSSLLPDGCPASIMYPYAFGNYPCYTLHRDQLLKSYKKQSGI